MSNTKVTDLSPLQGMPLEYLGAANTSVKVLSPLRGMPLIDLRLHLCTQLVDLAPLAESKELQRITIPQEATNIEFLRDFPRIERIGFLDDPKNGYQPDKTAAEFWQEYDAKQK